MFLTSPLVKWMRYKAYTKRDGFCLKSRDITVHEGIRLRDLAGMMRRLVEKLVEQEVGGIRATVALGWISFEFVRPMCVGMQD
jgi:hypothetical protein